MRLIEWAIMRAGAICMGSSLLAATPLYAGDKTDVLYMKNGDRMTCEIKSLNAGSLQVSLDYVEGTISVQWSRVQRLDSKRLFIVTLEDGSVYSGHLSIAEKLTPDEPTRLQISSGPGTFVLIDKNNIVNLGETSEDFWQRFAVDLQSGIIYSKGNQSAQYNLSSSVTYARPRWAAGLDFNSSLSSNAGAEASTRNQLDLDAYHLMPWKNYFYAGQLGFLQSTEQGISLRTNVSGGVGKYLKHSGRVSVSLLGGLGWQNTQYSPTEQSEGAQDILALLVNSSLRVVTFSKTNLEVSVSILPALSEPGRFFFNSNAAFYVKLFSNLTYNLSFYGSWDTEPPATYSGSDYGLSSGLGWTFGNTWTPR
jgi:hypothetical protein